MSARATDDRSHVPRGGKRAERWWAPRNWRVRTRLIALVVIPTVVALVLGGARVTQNVITTVTHDRVEGMASLSESVVAYSNELGRERTLAAMYIAEDPQRNESSGTVLKRLKDQYKATKRAEKKVTDGIDALGDPGSESARARLDGIEKSFDTVEEVRGDVTETDIGALHTVLKYRSAISALTSFSQSIADTTDDTELRESVDAMTALINAREQFSQESALMLYGLTRGSMSGGITQALQTNHSRAKNDVQNFIDSAPVPQRDRFDRILTGEAVDESDTAYAQVMRRAEDDRKLSTALGDNSAEDYEEVAGDALTKMQKAEGEQTDDVKSQSASLKDSARNLAILDSLLVLALIVAVFGITVAVARSLVRPLRALRTGALRIAHEDLPDSISRMQGMSAPAGELDVAPVEVGSRDEIAEVAESFDEVHRVALRLASEEAVLRSNVNAMFVNLSRRSQTLVERQLRLIDGLEQGEQDSDRLSDLFQLDHLATRMRRNNENLLVLSGQDNTRKWAQPVPLVDVLRGAISEVEQYERVNVRAPSHISVLGRPVNDVIHLVAELVENATSFSSHDSQVAVVAHPVDDPGGGVYVEVTDSGIGMPPEEIEGANRRLAEPPVIDVAVSRRMGLFVVSRLAARHGIRVWLAPGHNGGITAAAVFPSDILITPVEPGYTELDAGPVVPDTYAEAAAAFAASPAPAEPGEPGHSSVGDDAGQAASSLPKRRPGEARAAELPSSGEDPWAAAGWTSPPPSAGEPDPPSRAPFEPGAWSPSPPEPQIDPPVPPEGPQPPAEESPADPPRPWSAPSAESGDAPPAGEWSDRRSWEPEVRDGYGSTAYLSGRYGTAGQDTVVPPSPEDSESLPIFDSLESNWFRRRTGGASVADPESGPIATGSEAGSEQPAPGSGAPLDQAAHEVSGQASADQEAQSEDTWHSDADRGWQAARTAAEPIAGGLTTSGLPKRVPKANLVPGTAPQQAEGNHGPSRSAERVRNRFAGFQRGVREGRNQSGREPSEER